MESDNERAPSRIDSINDPVLKKALEKQPGFMARLDHISSYDDIIYAVENAAVDDGTGELVVFDIDGYEEGYEDEKIEATKVPLSTLISAIEYIRDTGVQHDEEIRTRVKNINVLNAVRSVWARELPLTEEQIITDKHE
jgi:hypothetical protein